MNALEITSTELRNRVEKLVHELAESQQSLNVKAVQLGAALLAVKKVKAWAEWGHKSYGSYINSLREQVDKGRTSLYAYVSIAENLLPYVAEKEIEAMGLSKAAELKKMVVFTGKKPSPALIEKAVRSDVKLDEFKAEVAEEYNVRSADDKGTWTDIGGFYATADERKEIEHAIHVAKHTDPVIPPDLSEWAQRKEYILRWAREFIAEYGQLVEQGKA